MYRIKKKPEILTYTISERSKNYVNDNPEIFTPVIYEQEYEDYLKRKNRNDFLEEQRKIFEWKHLNIHNDKKPRNLIKRFKQTI